MLSTALWESTSDDLTSEALLPVVKGLGNTARTQAFPLITSEEFKAAMAREAFSLHPRRRL